MRIVSERSVRSDRSDECVDGSTSPAEFGSGFPGIELLSDEEFATETELPVFVG